MINDLQLVWSFLLSLFTSIFNMYTISGILSFAFVLYVVDKVVSVLRKVQGKF